MVLVDFLPLIVVGFAASIGLTPISRKLAHRFGIVDKPSARKVHVTPIPLMGGLAIYGAFLIALFMFRDWPKYVLEMGAIIGGATWLAVVGLIDDRVVLNPYVKFAAQFLAAGLIVLFGIHVALFRVAILDTLLTLFWIMGIINAINFLDNMDGLAAGVSAIAAFFLFVLSLTQGQELVAGLSAALCGSAIGFLIYNFNPATTFMGDMGSMVLGFLLAVLGIKLRFPSQSLAVSWMIPILVLGLPIFDTTLVVFTRLREGRSPLQGGKDHTSHRLVTMGLSHRAAVVTLYGICALLGLTAVFISQARPETAALVEVGIGIAAIGCFIILEIARVRYMRRQAQKPSSPA